MSNKFVIFDFNFDEVENFVGGCIGKNEKGQTVVATVHGALVIATGDKIVEVEKDTFEVRNEKNN